MELNKELIAQYPWTNANWHRRSKFIAKCIHSASMVLDLGGGLGTLHNYLKDCNYVSIDLKKWTSNTIVADFNKNEYPNIGQYDYIICQGILEYIENPEYFLRRIRKYGKILIGSYWFNGTGKMGRKNDLSLRELKDLFKKTGWDLVFISKFSNNQKIFFCSKI